MSRSRTNIMNEYEFTPRLSINSQSYRCNEGTKAWVVVIGTSELIEQNLHID